MTTKSLFRFNIFRKKSRKGPPGGIEVKTTTILSNNNLTRSSSSHDSHNRDKAIMNGNNNATSNSATTNNNVVAEDEVSAMTPATGMPPDSPDRLRNLTSLLRPLSQSTPNNDNNNNNDKNENDDDRAEALLFHADFPDEDEVSAITPPTSPEHQGLEQGEAGTKKKSTTKKYHLRWKGVSPRNNNLLPGDDDNDCDNACTSPGTVTVYEEDEASSSEWERRRQPPPPPQARNQTNTTTAQPPMKILSSTTNHSPSRQSVSSSSWLTRTRYFQKAIDSSFEMIDADNSGDVSLEELYAGLLLIHLNMAVYVGPPACRPASKAYVTEIFHLLDADDSGTLTKDEYAKVVKILYSQVFTRIVMQWSLTLMIVPIMTQYIIKYFTLLYFTSSEFSKSYIEYLDPLLQDKFWKVWSILLSFALVRRVVESSYSIGKMIPSGMWKTLPFTILTLGQTSILLPWVLHHVENIFRRAARSSAAKTIEAKQEGKE